MTPRLSKRRWMQFAMGLVAVLLMANLALACPTCKDGLGNGQASMVQGYFLSILFMMSMPFLILFGVGGYFYYLVRKAQAQVANNAGSTLAEAHSAVDADRVPLEV